MQILEHNSRVLFDFRIGYLAFIPLYISALAQHKLKDMNIAHTPTLNPFRIDASLIRFLSGEKRHRKSAVIYDYDFLNAIWLVEDNNQATALIIAFNFKNDAIWTFR